MKKKIAYVLIAHGSRDPAGPEAFWELVRRMRKALAGRRVEGAFLELVSPDLEKTIRKCLREGIQTFIVLPLLLFPGRHTRKDLPQRLADLKMKYPDLDFHYARPLGADPLLRDLLVRKAELIERLVFHKRGRRRDVRISRR